MAEFFYPCVRVSAKYLDTLQMADFTNPSTQFTSEYPQNPRASADNLQRKEFPVFFLSKHPQNSQIL